MKRLKKTALLLFLCLGALSATASVASAGVTGGFFVSEGQFQAENYPLDIGAEQTETHWFSFQSNVVKCDTFQMIGQVTGASGTLKQLRPNIQDCSSWFGGKVVTDVNTCRLYFTTGGQAGLESCDSNGGFLLPGLRFYSYNKAGELACSYNVMLGTEWSGVTYSNYGSGSTRGVQAKISVPNFRYQAKGSGCGKFTGTQEGAWSGSLRMEALNSFWS